MAITFLTNEDKTELLSKIEENGGGCITGSGAPIAETEGEVGSFYMDTLTGTVYKCTAVTDGTYTWVSMSVGSDGISTTAKSLIITILRGAVYSSDQSANITSLATEWAVTENESDDSGDNGGTDDGDETVTYTITTELFNVTSDNSASSINENESYTATLTAADGYTLNGATVTVTMNGVDVTADVYADSVISISAVTGNVEIIASAVVIEETSAELVTDGLMAYFDFRNLGDNANVTIGTTKGVLATQGDGALYSWATTPITSSDEYGMKTDRGMSYSAGSNTTQTDLGTEFTIVELLYGEGGGNGISGAMGGRPAIRPTYNTADGTVITDAGSLTDSTGYIFCVYRVNGNDLTIISNALNAEYSGDDYEDFVSWKSNGSVGRTLYGAGYGTAVAIYNRALTDVEIEEMRAFMETLEVA